MALAEPPFTAANGKADEPTAVPTTHRGDILNPGFDLTLRPMR